MSKRTLLAVAAVSGLSLFALAPTSAEAGHGNFRGRGGYCGPGVSRGYYPGHHYRGGFGRGYYGNRGYYRGYGRAYGRGFYGHPGYYGYGRGSGVVIQTPSFGFGYYGW